MAGALSAMIAAAFSGGGGGGGYTVIQTFTATSTWTCPAGVTEVEYLVVAGGGGGGFAIAGGGGAGGFRTGTGLAVTAGTDYTITVGGGGAGGTHSSGDSGFAGSSGNLSNCTVDGTNKVGYIGAPQSTNTTVAASDAGKHIYFTGGSTATLTVNTNATTAIDVGTTILVVNNNSGNLTISGAGVTFQLANGATGNRTVATKGMATLLKVATDTWYVSGAGVT